LPLCHSTITLDTFEAPNAVLMNALTTNFQGFSPEFADAHKRVQEEWNEEIAARWRGEMAAIIHANSSELNETIAAGRRRAQIDKETYVSRMIEYLGIETFMSSSDGLGSRRSLQDGNLTSPLLNGTGFDTVEALCSNVTIDNTTSNVTRKAWSTLCAKEYEVFEGPSWTDASDLLCVKDERMREFVLVSNMLNPVEHCNSGWTPDVCIGEGKALKYSIRLGSAPASDVRLTVSGKFLQTNVTRWFTPDDYMQPHEITVHMKENLAITGHYWFELQHTFDGGVAPVTEGAVQRGPGARGYDRAQERFVDLSTAQHGHVCTSRDKGRCIDEATAWSTARAPHLSGVTGWSPGKLYSSATGSYYPLSLPVLVLDNDEYILHEYLGEMGRLYGLDSLVETGLDAWRGPFSLGPSFFSANEQRCPDGETDYDDCPSGVQWDRKKKELMTADTFYPPQPPLIADCTMNDCTASGQDPGS